MAPPRLLLSTPHLPFLHPRASTPLSVIRPRRFSTRPALLARAPAMQMPTPAQPPQASMKILSKNAQGVQQIPSDVGLLERTFVMPAFATRPAIYRQPRERLKLEWLRFKSRMRDLASLAVYKFSSKPRPMLRRRQVAPTALALHQQMYTAFAEGDVKTLRAICADGILTSFQARIRNRGPERSEWQLHRHTHTPRVVSDRGARFAIEGAGLRQAVVRIQSRQSLTRYTSRGDVVPGTGEAKDIKEYLVLQKRLWKGEESPWLVWGTTEETQVDDVKQ
ncbi:MAG: hypothetical protein M1817_001393 [Caeruleum heppii]|nr:MAG: hypothetical protein M1817_001393 [Caeruleum heppii]